MNRKSSRLILGACAGLLALSLSLGGYALSAGQEPALPVQKIETAKTRADHEALAAFYVQEANTAQAKAEEHKQMAEHYKKGIGYGNAKTTLIQHCDYIAHKYQETAKENQALAKLHRELAAKAQQ